MHARTSKSLRSSPQRHQKMPICLPRNSQNEAIASKGPKMAPWWLKRTASRVTFPSTEPMLTPFPRDLGESSRRLDVAVIYYVFRTFYRTVPPICLANSSIVIVILWTQFPISEEFGGEFQATRESRVMAV